MPKLSKILENFFCLAAFASVAAIWLYIALNLATLY